MAVSTYPCLAMLPYYSNSSNFNSTLCSLSRSFGITYDEFCDLVAFLKSHLLLPESFKTPDSREFSYAPINLKCSAVFKGSLISGKDSRFDPCKVCPRRHNGTQFNRNFHTELLLVVFMLKYPVRFYSLFAEQERKGIERLFQSNFLFMEYAPNEDCRALIFPLFKSICRHTIALGEKSTASFEGDYCASCVQGIERLEKAFTKQFNASGYSYKWHELFPVVKQLVAQWELMDAGMSTEDALQLIESIRNKTKSQRDTSIPFNELGGRIWEKHIDGLILMKRRSIIGTIGCIDLNIDAIRMTEEYLKNRDNQILTLDYPSLETSPEDTAVQDKQTSESMDTADDTDIADLGSTEQSDSEKTPDPEPLAQEPESSVTEDAASADERKADGSPSVDDSTHPDKRTTIANHIDFSDPQTMSLFSQYVNLFEMVDQSDSQANADTGPEYDEDHASEDKDTETTGESGSTEGETTRTSEPEETVSQNKNIQRGDYGALLLTEDRACGFFQDVEEPKEFVRQLLIYEPWIAVEFAQTGTDLGLAVLGGGGQRNGFLQLDQLTHFVLNELLNNASRIPVYTQSIPMLYHLMRLHGISNPELLHSLSGMYYAITRKPDAKRHPDSSLLNLPLPNSISYAESGVMELLMNYEHIYQFLNKAVANESRARYVESNALRWYEILLGTLSEPGQIPLTYDYPYNDFTPSSEPDLIESNPGVSARVIGVYITVSEREGHPVTPQSIFEFMYYLCGKVYRETWSRYPVRLLSLTDGQLVYQFDRFSHAWLDHFENVITTEALKTSRLLKTGKISLKFFVGVNRKD